MGGAETLGSTIRALRMERGIGQAALADAARIRPHTLYRYECGDILNPRAATVFRIAEALGVRVDVLYRGSRSAAKPRRIRKKTGGR